MHRIHADVIRLGIERSTVRRTCTGSSANCLEQDKYWLAGYFSQAYCQTPHLEANWATLVEEEHKETIRTNGPSSPSEERVCTAAPSPFATERSAAIGRTRCFLSVVKGLALALKSKLKKANGEYGLSLDDLRLKYSH